MEIISITFYLESALDFCH
jgi:hypothetical protein